MWRPDRIRPVAFPGGPQPECCKPWDQRRHPAQAPPLASERQSGINERAQSIAAGTPGGEGRIQCLLH